MWLRAKAELKTQKATYTKAISKMGREEDKA